jgi:hypothetical protein
MARETNVHIGSGTVPFLLSAGNKDLAAGLTGDANSQYPLPSHRGSGLLVRGGTQVAMINPEDFSVFLGVKNTAITAETTAKAAPDTPMENRRAIIIFNNGANAIYVGGSDVTATTGLPVARNTSISIDIQGNNNMKLFVITATGTSNVRIMEVA